VIFISRSFRFRVESETPRLLAVRLLLPEHALRAERRCRLLISSRGMMSRMFMGFWLVFSGGELRLY